MALGLGASLSTVRNVSTPPIVTSGLVLKQNYDTGAVVPISDGAASFDGVDDYIDTGFQPDFIHTNATMSYWCKVVDFNNSQVIGCNNSKRFYLGVNTDNAMFGVGDSYKLTLDISAHISVDTWMHLCLVAEDGTATYYLDGVSRDTISYTQASATNPDTNFFIGARSHSSTDSWVEGNICNVGIWSAALTQAQIKSIMYKDYAGLTTSEKTNLVSWWDLDILHVDGSTVVDSHGSNNGTLT
tara:strand:- start:2132 stop:2857 length:726 start_codon:yes stop_codon:yes gene_type:complete